MILLLQLLALHFLCDFPLQGDFMARAKNGVSPLPGVPWWLVLGAHACIHAFAVSLLLTWPFALMELVFHFVLDDAKCRGWLGAGERGFIIDQALHVTCKLAYAGLFWGLS